MLIICTLNYVTTFYYTVYNFLPNTIYKIELSLHCTNTLYNCKCSTFRKIIPNVHITTDQTVFLYSRFNFKNTSLRITLSIVNSPDVTRTMNEKCKRIINWTETR